MKITNLTSRYFVLLLVIFLVNIAARCFSQDEGQNKSYRVMFYNLENYFDCFTDSTLSYNEFTPEGDLHWTIKKYESKTRNIYKVFQNISGWDGVLLAGVCELENENVLKHLLYSTPLKAKHYNYIHFDSPDFRGIDVALIYSSDFIPLYTEPVYLFHGKTKFPSRNILYVKGLVGDDTLHIFVNHWTSRYRGVAESAPLRMQFSNLLKNKTDSLLSENPLANIIIMGDFNDQPNDPSLKNLTGDSLLYNVTLSSAYQNSTGTVKFKEDWFTFDQIIISLTIKNGSSGFMLGENALKSFDIDWLMEPDEKYLGQRPFRTNVGFSYHGGYSDHLAVYLDLLKQD